jgi:ribonuclease HII
MVESSNPDLSLETELFGRGVRLIGFVDEAGRGPLAGPLHCGLVILGNSVNPLEGVRDSKLLTERGRASLLAPIHSWASATAIGYANPAEIDAWGMMSALRLALRRALAQLSEMPDIVVIDGNYDFLHRPNAATHEPTLATVPPALTRISADRTSLGVAAASILAKTSRDKRMHELDQLYPGYGWDRNKGYGTEEHRAAIATLGVTPQHRTSFKLT